MTITTIHGIAGTDLTTLLGTELSDIFIVDESQIYIEGRDGKDTVEIDSYLERVTIEAGEGSDNIIFSKEIDKSIVNLGEGNDTINFQNFTGSINGNEGNDELSMPADTTATNAIIRGNAGKEIFQLENVNKTIINGNKDDDIINIDGSTINSQIYAGRHADTINISSSTGSTIRGDANEDLITITGSLTKTIINGNADDDRIIITSPIVSSSSAYGGQGNDDIDVGGGALYINGGKGNDDINASSDAQHSIYGGSGEDSIYSASKNSLLIYGGLDKDLITLSGVTENNSIHTVDGGAANDIINGNRGIEVLDGGSEDNGADTIVSNGGNDTIYGRAGNDLIDLRSGADAGSVLVRAGAGDDVIEVSLNELSYLDNIRGDKGIDTLNVVGSSADFNMWETNTVAEGAFNSIEGVETLAFGSTRSSYTVSGTKTINLSSGAQAAGITKIDASNVTGFGDDVLIINAFQFSSRTNLTLVGSDDKDVNVHFTGGSGNDTLTTGKINEDDSDTLEGGLGEDTFNIIATDTVALIPDLGTGGSDTLVIANTAKGLIATVNDNYKASDKSKNDLSLADVVLNVDSSVNVDMSAVGGLFGYVINGGEAASTLQGSPLSDSITGNVRADLLIGGRGNDTIEGGGGADRIITGAGNNVVKDAGIGADIITHSDGTSVVIQNTGSDNVTLTSTRNGAFLIAQNPGERTADASGSTHGVWMDGFGAGANKVTYTGGSAADTIKGGTIGDVLTGNNGDDSITGGLGADTISIGGGTNTVVFTSGLTVDEITDYNSDDLGSFDLSELEANNAVVPGVTLDFVNGSSTSVLESELISIQEIDGNTTLLSTTNILHYSQAAVANAAALETAIENTSLIRSDGALARYDAFIIQYKNSSTNNYTYALAYLESSGVGAGAQITSWDVIDIATTDSTTEFGSNQFSFIA